MSKPITLLLCHDDVDLASTFGEVYEREGIRVVLRTTAEQALMSVHRVRHFDVVLVHKDLGGANH